VLASDGKETYFITNNRLWIGDAIIQSGVSAAKRCFWDWFGGVEWTYSVRSNSGYFGENIYKVSSTKCVSEGIASLVITIR